MDASAWDNRYAEKDLLWSVEPNRFVAAELADLPPGRALDLACGEGRNALWLASLCWEVTAVDFSPVAVTRAQALDTENKVDWQVADLTTWPMPETAYDLVLISYLHLPKHEMNPIFAKAAAALNPGGTFLFIGHDLQNLTEGTGGPQDPEVLHTPDSVTSALPHLKINRAERVLRPVNDKTAIDTLVRATA